MQYVSWGSTNCTCAQDLQTRCNDNITHGWCSIIPCTHGNLLISLDNRSGISGTSRGWFLWQEYWISRGCNCVLSDLWVGLELARLGLPCSRDGCWPSAGMWLSIDWWLFYASWWVWALYCLHMHAFLLLGIRLLHAWSGDYLSRFLLLLSMKKFCSKCQASKGKYICMTLNGWSEFLDSGSTPDFFSRAASRCISPICRCQVEWWAETGEGCEQWRGA